MMRRVLLSLALLSLAACSGGGGGSSSTPSAPSGGTSTPGPSGTPAPGSAAVTVDLVDGSLLSMASDVFDNLYLGIDKVELTGGSTSPLVIQSYASGAKTVDILPLTSLSSAQAFSSNAVPAGSYTGVRVVLYTATTTLNYTDSGGTPHTGVALNVPAPQSGFGFGGTISTDTNDGPGTVAIDLPVSLSVNAGSSYAFVVDVNAGESILTTSSGPPFSFKPVVVAAAQSNSGALTGSVKSSGLPVEAAEVQVLSGGTPVDEVVTRADGSFTVNALAAGAYTLNVMNIYTTLAGQSVTAVGCNDGVTPCPASTAVGGSFNVTAGGTTAVNIAD